MLWPAIVKDTHLLLRDRGALASLFVLPLIFVVAFGSMFGSRDGADDARRLPVHYADGDVRAAAVVAAIDASGLYKSDRLASADAVRAEVAAEDAIAGLILPAGFDPAAGVPAELAIDTAASAQVRAPIEGALRAIATRAVFGGPPAGVEVLQPISPPGLGNPVELSGFQVSVPGNAVLFGFFLALTVALSFVEERKTGTWARLLAAPVNRSTLLLAKLVPWLIVGLIQMAFLFGVGALVFGMTVGGSLLGVVALTICVVACAVALGLFIASFGGSQKQIGSVGSITLLVMGLLGGAMVPRPIMPETMQQIGLATPHAWALDGYYDLLVRDGTSVVDVWPSMVAVLAFAVVFATVGAVRFRWR